ncbi:cytochrome d ubiquinol oxidase subunit II [Nonomuraea deserti]|nr:cytochrome d ubiquinol oxidase subunit II [Nonomuraea deserti]
MTSEHGPHDQDEPPDQDESPEQDEPPEHDASVYCTPPPRTVTIASTVWICFGALLAAGVIFTALSPDSPPLSTGPIALLLWIGVAVALIVLAKLMRQGSTGARTALTVLGAVSLFGIWTVLFVAPAIVLQFLPDSNAWFRTVNPR